MLPGSAILYGGNRPLVIWSCKEKADKTMLYDLFSKHYANTIDHILSDLNSTLITDTLNVLGIRSCAQLDIFQLAQTEDV